MNFLIELYNFLSGPCLYISATLCIAGIARKAAIIYTGRRSGMMFPLYPVQLAPRRGVLLFSISLIFHAAVIIAPVTAAAHTILFDLSWGIKLPAASIHVTGILTIAAAAAGTALIIRRIFVRHVLAVSSWRDYLLMVLVLAPFATGYLARTGTGMYEMVIVIHCMTAHILIVSVGWTRLGHFVLYGASKYYSFVPRREAGV